MKEEEEGEEEEEEGTPCLPGFHFTLNTLPDLLYSKWRNTHTHTHILPAARMNN